MTDVIEFNKLYSSPEAKSIRDDISKIQFDIDYFSLKIYDLQKKLTEKFEEYYKQLGYDEFDIHQLGVYSNGKNAKK